jgi:hypothetical protein
MTPDQIALAAHQLGMHMAMKEIDTPAGLDRWRRHNLAASSLREKVGFVYQPYAFPNKALVKALYNSLQEGVISRADFAACLPNVMGKHRDAPATD